MKISLCIQLQMLFISVSCIFIIIVEYNDMQFTLINFAEEFLATKNNINMDVVRFYDAPPKNFIKVKKKYQNHWTFIILAFLYKLFLFNIQLTCFR